MKVILKEEVKSLGVMGDVVKVAPGYARNYLIPRGYAVEANIKNISALDHDKRVIQERAKKYKSAAGELASRLSSVSLSFKAKVGEEGKLFGSITSMDIAEQLHQKGYEVDRKKISIAEPIKRLGEHTVEVSLGHEVTAKLTVNVEAE